eukprot:scaffold14617_cov113-Skeletonema_dohrnii-CCMP3373.AAC.3
MSERGNNSSAESMLPNELLELCKSEFLSEDGLREIIERHVLTHHDHRVNDYKFFVLACKNERVTEGMIRYLLEYFPAAASATYNDGWATRNRQCSGHLGYLPLHSICGNKSVTLNIVQLLIKAAPDSVRQQEKFGLMPVHKICDNRDVDETTAIEILTLLIEKYPEAVQHIGGIGNYLPIHLASIQHSPEFCRVLIEAYAGSERMAGGCFSQLPLHLACANNTVATVEYLYQLYPDAINHASRDRAYPIDAAMRGPNGRNNPTDAMDIMDFLLDCDPNVVDGLSLLHFVCQREHNSDIEARMRMQVIKAIYDSRPEEIEDNAFASNIQQYHQRIQAFINTQLVHARQAKDRRLMTTPDVNGQLPLHIALQSNVRLGSIRLLVKGNPAAVQSPDNSGRLPLHVACEHHASPSVVQYLVGLDISTLSSVDRDGNTALHYACLGAKYDTIALLIDKYDAVSVSKRNAHQKLPIDLLWGSNEVQDRESVEYTESIFRLLKAYPETVMSCNVNMKQQAKSEDFPCQNVKKRKLGAA